jgi:hypothetical protein
MVQYKPPLSFIEALRFGSFSLPEQILLTKVGKTEFEERDARPGLS